MGSAELMCRRASDFEIAVLAAKRIDRKKIVDTPLTCAPKGPTLLAPPVPDLCHDPTYCILNEIVGRVGGGHGRSILVRPVHIWGSNLRESREATVSSNSSPIADAAAIAKPCQGKTL